MDDRFERAFERGWLCRLKAIELRAAAAEETVPEAVREQLLRSADRWDASAAAAERRALQVKTV